LLPSDPLHLGLRVVSQRPPRDGFYENVGVQSELAKSDGVPPTLYGFVI
jgi:hypothetical protein